MKKEYNTYHFSGPEMVLIIGKYNALFLMIAKLFYNFLPAFILGNLFFPYFVKREEKRKVKERKKRMNQAFREFILSFGNSLRAGYSIENAFQSAYEDLKYMFSESSDFLKECRWMVSQMQNNQNLEDLLEDFAHRSDSKDIRDFALVFKIAKKSGGNLTQMIQDSAQIMHEKMSVKEEIGIMLAAKKMEQLIMDVVPLAIMFYISFTSKGYFDVLYHNPAGIIIMTACLGLYFLSFLLSEKIMAIEMEE